MKHVTQKRIRIVKWKNIDHQELQHNMHSSIQHRYINKTSTKLHYSIFGSFKPLTRSTLLILFYANRRLSDTDNKKGGFKYDNRQ